MRTLSPLRSTLQSHIRQEQSDFDNGVVAQVISTGDLARDGAIIEPSGWVLDNYRRNPVVLYGHGDGGGEFLPIARAREVAVEGSELVSVNEFDLGDPFAREVLRKIRSGFLHSTSVRWRPLEPPRVERRQVDGKDAEVVVFRRNDLLEQSYVAVPADPGAVIKRDDGNAVDLRAYAAESTESESTAEPQDVGAAALSPAELIAELDARAAEGVITPAERAALAGLYRRLGGEHSDLIAALTPELRGLREDWQRLRAAYAQRPDPMEVVVRALARYTGRGEASIRKAIGG